MAGRKAQLAELEVKVRELEAEWQEGLRRQQQASPPPPPPAPLQQPPLLYPEQSTSPPARGQRARAFVRSGAEGEAEWRSGEDAQATLEASGSPRCTMLVCACGHVRVCACVDAHADYACACVSL